MRDDDAPVPMTAGHHQPSLYRHSLGYLWGRGIPSVINFAAIAIYTRLVSPAEFGHYALTVAGVLLANAILFQWLRLSLLRFLTGSDDQAAHLRAALYGFAVTMLLSGVLSAIIAALMGPQIHRATWLLGTVLLWVHAWHELNGDILRSRFLPAKYGVANTVRAVVTVALGASLATLGMGGWGLLTGVLIGTAAPAPLFHRWIWAGLPRAETDTKLIRVMFRYGLPLTASLSLSFVIRGSDRIMLNWLLDSSAVGAYAAGYDIAQNSLEVLMAVVNAAAFPLAVSALSRHGVEAARRQLATNLGLLTAVALPATAGLIMVAPNVSQVMLGASFQSDAAKLIPWVAAGVLLSGLRAYYVDHAFQLGRRTSMLIFVLLAGAIVNVTLNVFLIPLHGLLGAAYATVAAYSVSIVAGVIAASRTFPLPLPLKNLGRTAVATLLMVVALGSLPSVSGPIALLVQILVGVLTYATTFVAVDGLGTRTSLVRRFARAKGQ